MLQLHELKALKKKRKRVGRGGARGGTSGRGEGGQLRRTGARSEIPAFFEGGQMPLSRRLPCHGFTNIFKKEFDLVNTRDLEKHFKAGETVNQETLVAKGLVKKISKRHLKVLGDGALSKNLTVHAHAFSKTAADAIVKAGGVAQQIKEIERGSVAS